MQTEARPTAGERHAKDVDSVVYAAVRDVERLDEVLFLDEAMAKLAANNPRQGRVVAVSLSIRSPTFSATPCKPPA